MTREAPGAVDISGFDLTALPASFYENPYPTYHALRDQAPVYPLPSGGYFLTRYADCIAVYKDAATFASDKKVEYAPKYGDSPLFEHHTTSLVFNDPPLHTRVRKIIAGAFTPRAIADMETPVVALVDRLLDQMTAKHAAGMTVDLIADFAAAIPVEVIGNLLAVPHAERSPLRDWSLAILGALEPKLNAGQMTAGNQAVTEFLAYLRDLVARRRANPGDPERDILTRLLLGDPKGSERGETLSELELLHNVIFILNAGHETTTNLIGNGLIALLDWPAERARLCAEPDLIKPAVEEMLRFESSNQLGNRRTTRAVRLGGVDMPSGMLITIGIGAANRDPAIFANPDRLNVGRTPNPHLAFGSGPHHCAGLNVARLEGRVAVQRFLTRFPNYRLAGVPKRGGRARFRGFLSAPILLGT
jgi:cytochrome P450